MKRIVFKIYKGHPNVSFSLSAPPLRNSVLTTDNRTVREILNKNNNISTNLFLTPKVIALLFLCFKKWSWFIQYNDKTELCVPKNQCFFPESQECQF